MESGHNTHAASVAESTALNPSIQTQDGGNGDHQAESCAGNDSEGVGTHPYYGHSNGLDDGVVTDEVWIKLKAFVKVKLAEEKAKLALYREQRKALNKHMGSSKAKDDSKVTKKAKAKTKPSLRPCWRNCSSTIRTLRSRRRHLLPRARRRRLRRERTYVSLSWLSLRDETWDMRHGIWHNGMHLIEIAVV